MKQKIKEAKKESMTLSRTKYQEGELLLKLQLTRQRKNLI